MAARGIVSRRILRNSQEIMCCDGLVMSVEGAGRRTVAHMRQSDFYDSSCPRPWWFYIGSFVYILEAKRCYTALIWTILGPIE